MELEAANQEIAELDKALKAVNEQEDRRRQQIEERERTLVGNLRKLPQLLRVIGALVLLGAAFTFMLQEWSGLNHLMRYYSFLGFTSILAAAGFFCGLHIKEDKGARTFLALAAAIIPVHFLQLGGLIYSRFKLDAAHLIPSYFLWQAPDLFTALLTTALALLVLCPICYLSMLSLCRPQALRLSASYLLLNSLLLLPLRDADWTGLLLAILLCFTAWNDVRALFPQASLRTKEGSFVRAMMAMPALLMLGRSLHLYPSSRLFLCALLGGLGVLFFFMVPNYQFSKTQKRLARYAGVLSFSYSWSFLSLELFRAFNLTLDIYLPFLCLPLCAFLFALSFYAQEQARGLRKLAVIGANFAMITQLLVFGGALSSFLLIAVAVIASAFGFTREDKGIFFSGLAGFAIGLTYYIRLAIELCNNFGPWVSLGTLGIVTVLASSLIERNYAELAKLSQQLKGKFDKKAEDAC